MLVVVTGSSYGIGKGCALEYLKHGHEVVGMDIKPSTIDNPNYTHYQLDIYDDELPDIEGVEILVNNAGVQNSGRDIDAKRIQEGFAQVLGTENN